MIECIFPIEINCECGILEKMFLLKMDMEKTVGGENEGFLSQTINLTLLYDLGVDTLNSTNLLLLYNSTWLL